MKTKWTVVQHSAYGYQGNPQFQQALESRAITVKAEEKLVNAVGGLVFDDYMAAEDFTETAMYPPESSGGLFQGIIPDAKGTFSEHKIDGLAIYVPVRKVVG